MKEDIQKIYEDYGQLHEEHCDLHREDGSDDGCTCAVKIMVEEISRRIAEFISHDLDCKDEEQRKAVVEMYLAD